MSSRKHVCLLLFSACSAAELRVVGNNAAIQWRTEYELVRIEAYGSDSIRVRFTNARTPISDSRLGAILSKPDRSPQNAKVSATVALYDDGGVITNGAIKVVVSKEGACCSAQPVSNMKVSFFNTLSGRLLTEEFYPLHGVPARVMKPLARGSGGLFEVTYSLSAQDGEQFYGFGQRQHGQLGQRGMVLDFDQFNTEVSIPMTVSSRGYGLLWSVPARGRVELANNNRTRFYAVATRQVDYLVMTGANTMDILARFAEATGHAPPWPKYASGFWQCKNRYATQQEVLNVTRSFKERNIPLAVIVIDDDPAFSPKAGDWRLNPTDWPSPREMVQEIASDGYQVMISVWPTLDPASENYGPMHDQGLLTFAETGGCDPALQEGLGWTTYDPFNADARQYFATKVMENHYDIGINAFWMDADEGSGGTGEATPFPRVDSVFSAGSVDEVGMMHAWHHQRGIYDALVSRGALNPRNGTGVFTISRSGWAGSQRWGGAIWSGDIPATWDSLNLQLRAGLNVQLSGIVWWTFDTGGYFGLNVDDPHDQELYLRWLQWAGFVPIMRTHGDRRCNKPHPGFENCPNEPWSFGPANEQIINTTLWAREHLRPYIDSEMGRASSDGRPIMRPLFVDFANDTRSWAIDNTYMFGDALLVAPVLAPDVRAMVIYLPPLPNGYSWTSYWDRSVKFAGGSDVRVQVTMEQIPVFVREDVEVATLLPHYPQNSKIETTFL